MEKDEGGWRAVCALGLGRTRKASIWSLQGSVLHGSKQRCWRECILFQEPWEPQSHMLENHLLHR